MKGGVVPGGIWRRAFWATPVTCAIAVAIFTLGWKKILMMPLPAMDWLSICSISLTALGNDRSSGVTRRPATSAGDRPVYWITAPTTGMPILGKMSVGVL